jgi:uncharacterized iron-regulated membrane protein
MMSPVSVDSTASTTPGGQRLYAAAWRLHFYAGLYVLPFLFMLSITGFVMVFFTGFQSRLGMQVRVVPQAQVVAVMQQAKVALAGFPGGMVKEYIAPKAADMPGWVVTQHDGVTQAVAVNPYTAEVLKVVDKDHTVFAWAERIHGTLLLGDVGDRLIEIAAGLAVVMVVTGLYLFWPRHRSRWAEVFVPDLRLRGRARWRSWHACIGFWVSALLMVFLLTGMAWTGVWGGKLVQAWSTFPESKWDAVPTSDASHAALNPPGLHEVPWGLEQTAMPASGSGAGVPGVPSSGPLDLGGAVALAKRLGFSGQFHVQLPRGEDGVFTLSADSMSGDLTNPLADRTVHVDRYTGKVLAEVAFKDYAPGAKVMAVGTALHQGDLGWWNALLNMLACAAVAFLSVSGVVMWWKRRPAGSGRLFAPGMPQNVIRWKAGALVMLGVALLFPLAGAALVGFLLLDALLLSRVPALRRILS